MTVYFIRLNDVYKPIFFQITADVGDFGQPIYTFLFHSMVDGFAYTWHGGAKRTWYIFSPKNLLCIMDFVDWPHPNAGGIHNVGAYIHLPFVKIFVF